MHSGREFFKYNPLNLTAMKDASLQVSLDDLIFEHRNKRYGAYVLRKEYPRHVQAATLFALSLLLLLIPLGDLVRKRAAEAFTALSDDKDDGGVVVWHTDQYPPLPPLPKPPVTELQQPAAASPGARLVPVVDPNPDPVISGPVTVTLTGGGGTNTSTGAETGTGASTSDTAHTGTGTATLPSDAGDKVLDFVEQRPQYPGGDAALYKFLSQHIRYPSAAAAAGIEGKVFVSFVCDKYGNVRDVKIEKGIGAGLDEEAVRVVRLLQGFSPALQSGRPVNYRYVLPVNFRLK